MWTELYFTLWNGALWEKLAKCFGVINERKRALDAQACTQHTQEFWLFQGASTVQFVLAIEVLWYDPLSLSDSPSLCLFLSISFPSLHPPFQSTAIREAKWETRNVWARFVRIGRKREGVQGRKWEIKREGEMRETQRRGGEERKERRRPVLIGLCGHAGLWWSGLAKPCASIVGLALHASRASGQPQLTLVCSLAVSNVRPGRVVPPTSTLCSTVQEASLMGMDAWVWVYGLFGSTSLGWGDIPALFLLFTYLG